MAQTRLGGGAFNHGGPRREAEDEYDRLREAARREQGQHQHFASAARTAYDKGDGAEAHEMSLQSKKHAAAADALNKQASEYIFRENNAVGKVGADTIDLHGQFVDEAEAILEQRIRYARQTGQSHLHVIVGKGNHSPDHIQKIKPRVEQICRELGLHYETEHNEGRIFVDLTGAPVTQAPPYNYSSQHQPQHADYGKPHYESAYPLGNAPQYNYQQGYGAPAPMQYPGQQQMHVQEPPHQQQQEQGNIRCCGIQICVVM